MRQRLPPAPAQPAESGTSHELQAVRREYRLLFFYSRNLLTKVTLNCVNVDGDDTPGGGDFRADAARILS